MHTHVKHFLPETAPGVCKNAKRVRPVPALLDDAKKKKDGRQFQVRQWNYNYIPMRMNCKCTGHCFRWKKLLEIRELKTCMLIAGLYLKPITGFCERKK